MAIYIQDVSNNIDQSICPGAFYDILHYVLLTIIALIGYLKMLQLKLYLILTSLDRLSFELS